MAPVDGTAQDRSNSPIVLRALMTQVGTVGDWDVLGGGGQMCMLGRWPSDCRGGADVDVTMARDGRVSLSVSERIVSRSVQWKDGEAAEVRLDVGWWEGRTAVLRRSVGNVKADIAPEATGLRDLRRATRAVAIAIDGPIGGRVELVNAPIPGFTDAYGSSVWRRCVRHQFGSQAPDLHVPPRRRSHATGRHA